MAAAIVMAAEHADIEKTENPEPVVERDEDRIAALRKPVAMIDRQAAAFEIVGAAMDPDQHGPTQAVDGRRPDVQRQAVLRADTPGGTIARLIFEFLDTAF